MMGSSIVKIMKKTFSRKGVKGSRKKANDVKTSGFVMKRKSHHVCICSQCAKKSGCGHSKYVHIDTGDWDDLNKKYKYKIMGSYRMKRYIRKKAKEIKN